MPIRSRIETRKQCSLHENVPDGAIGAMTSVSGDRVLDETEKPKGVVIIDVHYGNIFDLRDTESEGVARIAKGDNLP